MPTYGYECKSCGHNFDVFQSMKDDPIKNCPECDKPVRRLINGGNGVIFKGSGFYVNDKGSNGSSSNNSSEAKTESSNAQCESCPMSCAAGS